MSVRNIILIGMMGAGKSTVGKILARRLGYSFLDTDRLIERNVGQTISHIFAHEGEAAFRTLESEMVQTVARGTRQVIATGGGVILNPVNVGVLKQNGIIIHLSANPGRLMERLQRNTSRPLLQVQNPGATLQKLLQQRLPLYREAADWEIQTDHLTPAQVAERIMRRLPIDEL